MGLPKLLFWFAAFDEHDCVILKSGLNFESVALE